MNEINFLLPSGFPQKLAKEVKLLIDELFIAEALERLPDDQAKVFYQLVKGKDKFSGTVFEFLELKKPGLLDKIFEKIERQVEKILYYKIKISYG